MFTAGQDNSAPAADWIACRWPRRPGFGVVLGTGAGQLADSISREITIPYSDIPGFPQSTALGHKGCLACGSLAGKPIVAMQGRFHLYEGYDFHRSTIGIRTMARLGVKRLVITNAAGGVNPDFRCGEIMIINSHIDLMFRTPGELASNFARDSRRDSRIDAAYDPAMITQALAIARRNDFQVHTGVYASVLGPNFETRSEYRFLRRVGADAVGMSTVPEVVTASALGIRVLALSVISNVANPDSFTPTSGHSVVNSAKFAAPNLKAIIEHAILESCQN